jgi:hypothetical protein
MTEIEPGKEALSSLKYFCVFIGYPYSGHSLVGSILDAHPGVVISHELHVGRLIRSGYPREKIFSMILLNSFHFAHQGRQWNNYQYTIPGEWNGRFDRLVVIGDKKGGKSAKFFTKKAEVLGEIATFSGLVPKYIHVIRNPYDMISTLYVKTSRKGPDKMEHVIHKILEQMARVEAIRKETEPENWHDLRHEELLSNPDKTIRQLFSFFNLTVSDGFIENCRKILFTKPHQSRFDVEWKPEEIGVVAQHIKNSIWFSEYTF